MLKHTLESAGAPTVKPEFINQHYTDTTAKENYTSVGTATVADWVNQTKILSNSDTPAAFGTTGQVLAVNAAVDALEFVDQSGVGIPLKTLQLLPGPTQMLVFNETTKDSHIFLNLDENHILTLDFSVFTTAAVPFPFRDVLIVALNISDADITYDINELVGGAQAPIIASGVFFPITLKPGASLISRISQTGGGCSVTSIEGISIIDLSPPNLSPSVENRPISPLGETVTGLAAITLDLASFINARLGGVRYADIDQAAFATTIQTIDDVTPRPCTFYIAFTQVAGTGGTIDVIGAGNRLGAAQWKLPAGKPDATVFAAENTRIVKVDIVGSIINEAGNTDISRLVLELMEFAA